MKSICTILLCLVLCTPFANAQETDFEIGFNSGYTLSNFLGDYNPKGDSEPLGSYMYGMQGQYNFSDRFSLVVNLNYERKGTYERGVQIYDDMGFYRVDDVKAHYNYITLPVLARFTYGDRGKTKVFINAGPYFAMLTNAELEYVNSDVTVDVDDILYTWNYYDVLGSPSLDIGLGFGVGVKVPVSDFVFLSFEMRNSIGLFNVANGGDNYYYGPPFPFVNGAVNFSTGFLFGLSFGL